MSALPKLLTLQEAAARISDKITADSLRTEARRGRLHLTRIAGKLFVTEEDLGAMLQRCRDEQRGHGSTSEAGEGGSRYGLSSTEGKRLAQDAAKATVQALKERSAATSKTNTSRPRTAAV